MADLNAGAPAVAAGKLPRIQPTEYKSGCVVMQPEMSGGCCGGKPKPPPDVAPFLHLPDEKNQQVVKVKKAYVIMNPHGGNGKGALAWQTIQPILVKAGIECILLLTERPRHATEYAQTKPLDDIDCIVAIGGDGTFFEVLNGLMTREDKKMVPLGLIPGGTGNSVLKTLNLDPSNWKLAAEAIVDGFVLPIDVGKSTSEKDGVHYFLNEIAWGLGADSNVTAENLRCCGPMRYDVGALWNVCLGKERHVRFVIDGEVLEGNYNIFLANNNQHAGSNMKFCPFSKLNDGLLDVIIFIDEGRMKMLSAFGELKNATHIYNDSALYYRFKRMEVHTPHNDLMNVDGDNVSSTSPSGAIIECLPGAVPIFYRRVDYVKSVPLQS